MTDPDPIRLPDIESIDTVKDSPDRRSTGGVDPALVAALVNEIRDQLTIANAALETLNGTNDAEVCADATDPGSGGDAGVDGEYDAGTPGPDAGTVVTAHDRLETLTETLAATTRRRPTPKDSTLIDVASFARERWHALEASPSDISPSGVDPATVEFVVETDATVVWNRESFATVLDNLLRGLLCGSGLGFSAGSSSDPISGSDVSEIVVGTATTQDSAAGVYEGISIESDADAVPKPVASAFDPGTYSATDGIGVGLDVVTGFAAEHGWSIGLADADDCVRLRLVDTRGGRLQIGEPVDDGHPDE